VDQGYTGARVRVFFYLTSFMFEGSISSDKEAFNYSSSLLT